MKEIDVYYEGAFVHNVICDKIIPNDETKCWLLYEGDNLIGSIPMIYFIVKNKNII